MGQQVHWKSRDRTATRDPLRRLPALDETSHWTGRLNRWQWSPKSPDCRTSTPMKYKNYVTRFSFPYFDMPVVTSDFDLRDTPEDKLPYDPRNIGAVKPQLCPHELKPDANVPTPPRKSPRTATEIVPRRARLRRMSTPNVRSPLLTLQQHTQHRGSALSIGNFTQPSVGTQI